MSISPKLSSTFSPVFSPTSLPLSCPLSLPIVPLQFVSHYSLALYRQYSPIISGQSLDSTNSRGAPPSCSCSCWVWYLGPWCPCRAWRPPCPTRSRPGMGARQGRRVNIIWDSFSPRVDWSYIHNIFLLLFFYL